MPDVPDGLGPLAGIYSEAAWAAREGLGKDFFQTASNQPWLGSADGTYTVPSGKTLYITDAEFSIRATYAVGADHPLSFLGQLYNDTTAVMLSHISGLVGVAKAFVKPLIIPAGEVFAYIIYNTTPVAVTISVSVHGFEI